jgi:hypothetical protein
MRCLFRDILVCSPTLASVCFPKDFLVIRIFITVSIYYLFSLLSPFVTIYSTAFSRHYSTACEIHLSSVIVIAISLALRLP